MSSLRFAILNPFPEAAEMGAAYRMIWAARKIGLQGIICNNTDDVVASNPDFVIAMHHFVGKLTDHITFGYMCNPPIFLDEDPFSLRNVLSYDGWLNSGGDVHKLHFDLQAASAKAIPSCYFIMSSHVPSFSPAIPKTVDDPLDLCYVGANWDGPRFQDVFEYLDRRRAIHIYGPNTGWGHCPQAYVGQVPCDGHSVFEVIRRHGIYLCLHKTEHRNADIVNLRALEGAAAGGVLVCDNHRAIQKYFGSNAYYINLDVDAESIGKQIEDTVEQINLDRATALTKARACHEIFKNKLSYEVLLQNVIRLYHEVRASRSVLETARSEPPRVNYIVRTGLRPAAILERCLQSILDQTYDNIEVLLVIVSSMFSQHDVITKFQSLGLKIKIIHADGANRGEALTSGLEAVTGKYVGFVDDDDVIYSDHTATHVALLEENPSVALSHGGSVRTWSGDRQGYLEGFDRKFSERQYEAPDERRRLNYFDVMTDDLWREMDNVITSNSFLARADVIAQITTHRGDLEVVEDYSLISEIWKAGHEIRQAWRVTSAYYWDDHLAGNSTFDRGSYVDSQRRFRLTDRLAHVLGNYEYEGPKLHDPDGRPSRRVVAGTQPIQATSMGSIDHLAIAQDGLITIEGWIGEMGTSVDQAIYLQLKTDGGIIVKQCEVVARPDVAEYFGSYEYYWSGFTLRLKVRDAEELHGLQLFSYSRETGWKEANYTAHARLRLDNLTMNMRRQPPEAA